VTLGSNKMAEINIKIPFKVSARTARLIGRENIATAKGAIIELVKNGYDADSDVSIVYFDNYYSKLHNTISEEYFNNLIAKGVPQNLLLSVYEQNQENIYSIKETCADEARKNLRRCTSQLSSLYIIDTGEGMTQKIIREHWMTIGTDNKAYELFTKSKRVKAGEKGIGRFALDKLGAKCEMITLYNPEFQEDLDENGNPTIFNGYKWNVNWEDFEGEFKTIENVNANLVGLSNGSLYKYIQQIIPNTLLNKITRPINSQHGTILKITELRDNWDDFYVEQIFSDLEILVPPKENTEFSIFLLSSLAPQKYGEIYGSVCDDFDYKLTARADEQQNVHIKISRKEYDIDLIPPEFFTRSAMQKHPYTLDTFRKGYWETTKTFSQLVPGFENVDEDSVFKNIGVFDFSFYYLKKAYASDDAEKFFYKRFKAHERKDWLDKFGGIKLFRDNFRVRPYGERGDAAFDWLTLGSRKVKSPAAVSKAEGGYRVETENVAGSIKISRLTNVDFEDKSGREGLQENKTFQIFKILITNIINEFESDRAYIAREMLAFYNERNKDRIDNEKAEELARKIIEEHKKKQAEKKSQSAIRSTVSNIHEDEKDRNLTIIAQLNEQKDEKIERLKEEQLLLRGLASVGLVLASFRHDLGNIESELKYRFDDFKNLIADRISEADFHGVEDRNNPFKVIEEMKKNDLKMLNWLEFSLSTQKKDKRKRKQLNFKNYFKNLKKEWNTIFENRAIVLDISSMEDIDMRVFEIDFDSIFSNLFVNSIYAFIHSKEDRNREIKISAKTTSKEIIIEYYDNGPGLSKDIINPDIIFTPMFTTKKNQYTGEDEGTGLGMWILKSIVEENDGLVNLLFPKVGFGIRISFPIKYK
jgi:signal transduction histidine kinase